MWCVFVSANGASKRFIAFTDEMDRLLINRDEEFDAEFYAAFPKESNADLMVSLLNSGHW